ncbi:hypothetical protein N7539_007352 [Penicillium diatomitis]|uniref:Xylanolytic transcriptional activator regulatory domain-containing protein n=1 Tax=Penicillium diatomitis TaxID=2819901 RepID=A0A9W9WUZ8_9EURO|nr:uncharacterized protein N7539_007352 [Penicillium diatomitis]KAJ5477208.1 hypothetical protein N7539_007352 [Penicillium diatomitis]
MSIQEKRLQAEIRSLKEDLVEVRRHLSTDQRGSSVASERESWAFVGDSARPQEFPQPAASILSFLWQIYLGRIDPVLKIIHVPTVQQHIFHILSGRYAHDASTLCLVYAVCYAAITTLSPTECEFQWGESRALLLDRYRSWVEKGFGQAGFPKSANITVLQAFLLYLICGQKDPRGPDAYAFLGVAIRIALKMGVHDDGASLNLSPFEIEMRRRIWWQIYVLDVLTAECQGLDPTILDSTFTTQLPSNVSDTELDPGMNKAPQARPGRTEMTFTLARFEIIRFARTIRFSDQFCRNNSYPCMDISQKVDEIDKFRAQLERQYLSSCDGQGPLGYFTVAFFDIAIEQLRLEVTKPRTNGELLTDMQTVYHDICMRIVLKATELRKVESTARWQWQLPVSAEMDALAYLMLELCLNHHIDARGALRKSAHRLYELLKTGMDTSNHSRWHHVKKLWGEVLTARELTCPDSSLERPAEPDPCSKPTTVAQLSAFVDETRKYVVNHGIRSPGDTLCPRLGPETAHTGLDSDSRGEVPDADITTDAIIATSVPCSSTNSPENIGELPGNGTLCEWSEAIIQQYWQITQNA